MQWVGFRGRRRRRMTRVARVHGTGIGWAEIPGTWIVVPLALAFVSLAAPARAAAQCPAVRLQAVLDSIRSEIGFPGATTAVALPDGTVCAVATGVADEGSDTPMTPETRMLAESIGKTFVAATVLALDREGRLDLDDPLTRWLGDREWLTRLPGYDAITIRQLLTHSSGLPDHVYTSAFAEAMRSRWREPGNPFPPDTLVAFIFDQPPRFPPGEAWAYTDTGYVLLGLVIEAATGSRWQDQVIRRFLVPLRLARTTPSDRRILPGLATGHVPADNPLGLPVRTTVAPGIMAWNPAVEDAGGGFVSTSSDLVRWARALYEGGAMPGDYLPELLSSVPLDSAGAVRYGLGVAIREEGLHGPTWGHAGSIPGYTSSLRYYPDHRIAIAFQINADAELLAASDEDFLSRIERRLMTTALDAEPRPTAEDGPTADRDTTPRRDTPP